MCLWMNAWSISVFCTFLINKLNFFHFVGSDDSIEIWSTCCRSTKTISRLSVMRSVFARPLYWGSTPPHPSFYFLFSAKSQQKSSRVTFTMELVYLDHVPLWNVSYLQSFPSLHDQESGNVSPLLSVSCTGMSWDPTYWQIRAKSSYLQRPGGGLGSETCCVSGRYTLFTWQQTCTS